MAISKKCTNIGIDKVAQRKFIDTQYRLLRRRGVKAADARQRAKDLANFYSHHFRVYK